MVATPELRQQLLDTVAESVDELSAALGALGEAYEQLDELTADTLEEVLFRPLQIAYGRLQRTHAGFAVRSGLPARAFAPAEPGGPPRPVGEHLDRALETVAGADERIAELQDSLLPVEVGDSELRAGLAEVRRLLASLTVPARELVRRLGR